MKKYLYIFTLLLGVIGLSSCSEHERTVYDGDELQAMFYSKTYSYSVVKTAETDTVVVKLFRGNTIGKAEVELKLSWTDTSDKPENSPNFRLMSNKILFEDGENESDVVILYEFDKLGILDSYKLTVELADPTLGPVYATSSSKASASTAVTVSRKLDYQSIGTGSWAIPLLGGTGKVNFEKFLVNDIILYRSVDFPEKGRQVVFVVDKDNKVTVSRQLFYAAAVSGYDVSIEGEGVKEGNVLKMNLLYHLPEIDYDFSEEENVLTLPESEK